MAPVAFVIGAGPKVGRGVSRMLKSKGYNVAVGARTPSKSLTWAAEDGVHPVSVDVTKTETITAAFAEVDKKYGPPSIVVYNPGAITIPKDRNDPLTIPVDKFADDVAFGTSGLFAAAQEAVAAFRKTPKDLPKVFIATTGRMSGFCGLGRKDTFSKTALWSRKIRASVPCTGNILPFVPANRPFFISLAVAKKAAAYQIELFSNSYQAEGFRFYFASQIARDGKGVRDSVLSGEAHGIAYSDLI